MALFCDIVEISLAAVEVFVATATEPATHMSLNDNGHVILECSLLLLLASLFSPCQHSCAHVDAAP